MMWRVFILAAVFAAAPLAEAQEAPAGVTAPADVTGAAPAAAEAPAPAAPDAADDEAEAAELQAVLASETQKATKTRLNSDFVPGIVTVLDAEEMKALGAVTVWDALKFVPGIQPRLDQLARPTLTVRGVSFPFNNGNVKLLVDAVPLNRDSAGINSFLLEMPLEQVERIEVTRGPGSVAYGDFAFMGLVNIVTRKDRTGAFGRAASDGRYDGGAGLGLWDEDRPFGLSLGVTGRYARGAEGVDGNVVDENRRMATLAMRYEGFTLHTQYLNHELLYNDATAPSLITETDWSLKGQYEIALGSKLKLTPSATVLYNDLADGVDSFRGNVVQGALEAEWRPERRHVILLRGEYGYTTIDAAKHTLQFQPPPPPGAPAATGPEVIEVGGHQRTMWSGTAQDSVSLFDGFVITPGFRFDAFSDVAGRLTPRFSAAWQAAEHHILKGQYAEGFRSPTFFELYDTGERARNLGFENNATSELHYIYRRPSLVGRATVFRTLVDDMIYVSGAGFTNDRAALVYGSEGEWEQDVLDELKVMANVSWAKGEDNRNDKREPRPIENAPAWMASLGVLGRPFSRLEAGGAWNHVADSLLGGGYDTVDATVGFTELGLKALSARGGVKNLLNDRVSYIAVRPNGFSTTQVPGRTVWLQVSFSD